MKERPILFTGEMVRAILEGRKTQTRRPLKWPVLSVCDGSKRRVYAERDVAEMNERLQTRQRHPSHQFCPIGQPGDRLWVRETWAPHADMPRCAIYRCDRGGDYQDTVTDDFRWRPSIHMPRWASRITLEIVRVSIERVQDITDEGAMAEGLEIVKRGNDTFWMAYGDPQLPNGGQLYATFNARKSFGCLWQSIYGTWEANPWVWAVEFRRIKP